MSTFAWPATAALRAAALAFAAALFLAGPASARDGVELLMFHRTGCEWCEAWEREVGVVYDKTKEGAVAPLSRTNLFEPKPEGVTLERSVRFTPTFILMIDGQEIGRIEGYPGEDLFWGMLEVLLEKNAAAIAAASPKPDSEPTTTTAADEKS